MLETIGSSRVVDLEADEVSRVSRRVVVLHHPLLRSAPRNLLAVVLNSTRTSVVLWQEMRYPS